MPALASVPFSHTVFIEHLFGAGAVLDSGETWKSSLRSFLPSTHEQLILEAELCCGVGQPGFTSQL